MIKIGTEKLYRLLYPMRIVLITSKYQEKSNVMSATWCFPISSEPPMFGVCIAKKRYSYELIHASKQFAINIPGAELKNAIIVCGRASGREKNKFKDATLTVEIGKLSLPLIKECNTSIECELVAEYELGDHILFVGEVNNIVKRKEGKGLYHLGGDEIEII